MVGVAQAQGDSGFASVDNMMYVPYTTMQQRVTGNKNLNSIVAQAVDESVMGMAYDQV